MRINKWKLKGREPLQYTLALLIFELDKDRLSGEVEVLERGVQVEGGDDFAREVGDHLVHLRRVSLRADVLGQSLKWE